MAQTAFWLVSVLALLPACGHDHAYYECANGECICGDDASCDFLCASPPCHVRCQSRSACSGECANGNCTCDRAASCEFACSVGPCHVQCKGDNAPCDGECANGGCTCGPNSTCHFACTDHNCSASCAAGSHCVLECPEGRAGTQGCVFSACASGSPTICPGGLATTCNADCP
jgi:hypothetical protein